MPAGVRVEPNVRPLAGFIPVERPWNLRTGRRFVALRVGPGAGAPTSDRAGSGCGLRTAPWPTAPAVSGKERFILEQNLSQIISRQIEFFEQAFGYPGRPRERIVALWEAEELFCRLYPHQYRAMLSLRLAAHVGGLVPQRTEPVLRCESTLMSLLLKLTLEALRTGDLKLGNHQRASEPAFTLWSLAFGARSLMSTGLALRKPGTDNELRVARDTADLLLDALGWAPFSSQWDYRKTRRQAREALLARTKESHPAGGGPGGF